MGKEYYVVFFDDSYNIKYAYEVKNYPYVKDIVYIIKTLEEQNIKYLRMDILSKEEYLKI